MKNAKEFKLIECRGTPYEIGRQWGEGCKDSILKISENIGNSMTAFLPSLQARGCLSGYEASPYSSGV